MKSNWIKYVFIIFIIGILVFSVYKFKKDEADKKLDEVDTSKSQEEMEKEIKLGIAGIDTINPILSKNKNVQNITKLIYEPLVNLSSDYKAEPCLAKEWAKQSGNSYLVKLREGVRWSDGQSFTSEDVRFTIDRLKDSPTIYSENVQDVDSIDIIDDYTIKINLSKEIPFFEYNLTFPILSKENYEGEDFNNTTKNNKPIGTGKFKISEAESSYIILEKNTSWWNKEKEITLEKITINLYSSVGELYNSFKLGNLDLISTENDNLTNYIGTIGYSSKEMKDRKHTFLALNTANYFLSKEEVRKAISYSIDKSNITTTIFGGKYYTSSFPLDYGNWLCKEQDASSGYNLEQAKQLLKDAGWSLKKGSWQKTENYKTQKLALNLLVKASDASKVSVAENIRAQLLNQGIIINIVQATDEQYNNMINNKSYDIALCSLTLSPSPNLESFFGDGNLANYTTDEIKNIMNEVKNTTDENVLKEKYKRLNEIYKTNIPYISLYNSKYTVAYNSALVGDFSPNWFYQFYGIEEWYK